MVADTARAPRVRTSPVAAWPDTVSFAKAKAPQEFTLFDGLPRMSVGKIGNIMLKESAMEESAK